MRRFTMDFPNLSENDEDGKSLLKRVITRYPPSRAQAYSGNPERRKNAAMRGRSSSRWIPAAACAHEGG